MFANFKMAIMAAILVTEQNDFSDSKSLCCFDASHQVLAQYDLRFERRCCFDEFQDGNHGGHLGYRNRLILAILNLPVAHYNYMPPMKCLLNPTYDLGGDVI